MFVAIEELLMVASRVATERGIVSIKSRFYPSGHFVNSLSGLNRLYKDEESEDFKKLGKQIGQGRHAINSGVPKA